VLDNELQSRALWQASQGIRQSTCVPVPGVIAGVRGVEAEQLGAREHGAARRDYFVIDNVPQL
jgi:hypothetical protein